MSENKPFRPRLKSVLATSTIAGMAGAMLATGLPSVVSSSMAEPVSVEAPKTPGFADVVEAVSPAVVSVRVQNEVSPVSDRGGFSFDFGSPGLDNLPEDHPMRRFFDQFQDRQFGQRPEAPRRGPRPVSQGSGFFISDDGYLVTNNHVVEGGESYSIILDDGTELEAELIGTDSRTDLAVLKVDGDRTFPYVEFGDDSKTRIGDWVVAVGNPFGLGGSVTAGIVSARGREIGAGPYDDFLQIDAAVNRGNSGGPTFNLNGKVIGVNTAIFSPSGGNVGIAFAIPATIARDVINDLIDDGSVERGWLGVQIQPVTDDIAESLGLEKAAGALVTMPQEDTPAAAAGIEPGDVVTAVNGESIEDSGALARKIAGLEPGATVELTVWRNGAEETVPVELGTFPSDQQSASMEPAETPAGDYELSQFGLTVVPSEDGEGVVVTEVDPDGPAAERGFEVGDVILRVQDRTITNAEDISEAIADAADNGRGAALFQLRTETQNRFVALPIEKG
ncbi:Do family serine endopeptidase [Pararhizobium haloflavum]|uniref:Do family serine endopeptidase n=1 Tax=Pararhizobium haloflavum TaxID=2037914 RepID=UPI000C186199|nr:Do family serine endopeptidase [Pararhizobium haloflavum]